MQEAKQLTEHQRAFCREYVIDFVAKDALIRAGTKSKQPATHAWRLLQLPHVQQEIQRLVDCAESDSIATLEECLEVLTDIIRGHVDDCKPTDRRASIETLAKMKGYFSAEKHEIKDDKTLTIKIVK